MFFFGINQPHRHHTHDMAPDQELLISDGIQTLDKSMRPFLSPVTVSLRAMAGVLVHENVTALIVCQYCIVITYYCIILTKQ